jgi:hypothetical protein
MQIEWISVKDKLPLDDINKNSWPNIFHDQLLGVFDDGDFDIEVAPVSYTSQDGWCYPDGTPHDYWKDKITHWMHFPEPPSKLNSHDSTETYFKEAHDKFMEDEEK